MDSQPVSLGSSLASLPSQRPADVYHVPNVSSPLNPDASAHRPKAFKPAVREQREKKDSLKKREAMSTNGKVNSTNERGKHKFDPVQGGLPSPIRYNHILPKEQYHYTGPREPTFSSHEPDPFFVTGSDVELRRPMDHAENKKAFRYTHCIADPDFPHSRYYRQTDGPPYHARLSFEDSDKWFHFNDSATILRNEKGWRMGRANVCVREGAYYYEVKILRGVARDDQQIVRNPGEASPYIRMGWARREAPLDAPPGFDGYSYGISDVRFEPMHKSRASKFLDDGIDRKPKKLVKGKPSPSTEFAITEPVCEGDVVGLEIRLPSLHFHRKIVDGTYNPAVDLDAGSEGIDDMLLEDGTSLPIDVVRDRFPVPYKGTVYFETIEYQRSRGMDSYGDRGPFSRETPTPNHDDPTLRCLPHSSIRVYKNGKLVGTAFRNLMAFLPPASVPQGTGARQGLDDGMLGYYPAIGSFSGGIAQVNFGPDFWFPPSTAINATQGAIDSQNADTNSIPDKSGDVTVEEPLNTSVTPKAIAERYIQQIAEDVLYDIVDEADFFVQDGGGTMDPASPFGAEALAED